MAEGLTFTEWDTKTIEKEKREQKFQIQLLSLFKSLIFKLIPAQFSFKHPKAIMFLSRFAN